MKKSIWIFLLAVLLPSIVLGWLALRSADEQQIILENRTAALYQKETENAAVAARSLIDDQRRAFNETVRQLLAKADPQMLADNFSTELAKAWPRKAIGFSIGANGNLCAPAPQRAKSNPAWQKFLLNNGSFLASTTPATVYWVSGDELAKPEQFRKAKTGTDLAANTSNSLAANTGEGQKAQFANAGASAPAPPAGKEAAFPRPAPQAQKTLPQSKAPGARAAVVNKDSLDKAAATQNSAAAPASAPAPVPAPAAESKDASPSESKQEQPKQEQTEQAPMRNVAPQRLLEDNRQAAISQLTTTTTDFRALTAGTNEGVVTRFVQDQLNIIFWLRPAQAPDLLFGCLIEADDLRDLWPEVLPVTEADDGNRPAEFVLAMLDDKARPVVTAPVGVKGRDWKHPFVASEIGEALPHWEAALYLQRPEQLRESAQLVRRTLLFLIAGALAVIACGGWLVVADARRQLALAQQKTDFVSNVSHELKTPLTSIRMFAEMMQNGRGESAAKHPQYLRIIMVEAERLTRLINNVLDFARLERKQKQFDKKPLDLHAVIERAWEGHELHLQEGGFTTRWQAAPGPYPVVGDEDALAQILVNLLSNAEKYAGERKEVELHSYLDAGHACVSVLDRGIGVPPGDERKIFESFYRAHDSLSSGIQGSGLGLTLAQQLAHEHGGEILYQPRPGGGSNFTLRMPLAEAPKTV
ncbi:MAG: HAMP domain-containing sensor histidine kinase [Chthoniobacter sp.]|nr:HAMP domain-containing sensor histidine kinase [Chthoniobacter sp.]